MGLPPADYPALAAAHLDGAKLFASREEMIGAMGFLEGGVIGEVGVGEGDFSEFLLERLKPARFVAFDTFTMDEYPHAWGRPAQTLFDGKSHLDFYRQRFSARREQIVIERGWSHQGLARHPAKSFDLIYLDGGRDREIVRRDAELAKERIRENGILVFAGYTMFDHLTNEPYGVVATVNQLVTDEDWRVFGLALHREMFCDIAVRR